MYFISYQYCSILSGVPQLKPLSHHVTEISIEESYYQISYFVLHSM